METEIDNTYPTKHIDQDLVNQVIPQFSGTIKQVPPIYSAKKVDGKRAYDLARKGIEVTLKENDITIIDLELKLTNNNQIIFKVNCGKGTYIRSLANDIGKALNSGGHLIQLRRTRSGKFTTSNAKSIEEWVEIINNTEVAEEMI